MLHTRSSICQRETCPKLDSEVDTDCCQDRLPETSEQQEGRNGPKWDLKVTRHENSMSQKMRFIFKRGPEIVRTLTSSYSRTSSVIEVRTMGPWSGQIAAVTTTPSSIPKFFRSGDLLAGKFKAPNTLEAKYIISAFRIRKRSRKFVRHLREEQNID